MPLDDAMKFVSHNFDSYLQTLREKKRLEAPPDYSRMPDGFVPPTDHVVYLLNLLADGRMLTSLELKELLDFVVVRRDKLLAAEGLPMATIAAQRPSFPPVGFSEPLRDPPPSFSQPVVDPLQAAVPMRPAFGQPAPQSVVPLAASLGVPLNTSITAPVAVSLGVPLNTPLTAPVAAPLPVSVAAPVTAPLAASVKAESVAEPVADSALKAAALARDEKTLLAQQAELQAKIMSLLNPSQTGEDASAEQPVNLVPAAPTEMTETDAAKTNAPQVQRALDTLLQSDSLMKRLSGDGRNNIPGIGAGEPQVEAAIFNDAASDNNRSARDESQGAAFDNGQEAEEQFFMQNTPWQRDENSGYQIDNGGAWQGREPESCGPDSWSAPPRGGRPPPWQQQQQPRQQQQQQRPQHPQHRPFMQQQQRPPHPDQQWDPQQQFYQQDPEAEEDQFQQQWQQQPQQRQQFQPQQEFQQQPFQQQQRQHFQPRPPFQQQRPFRPGTPQEQRPRGQNPSFFRGSGRGGPMGRGFTRGGPRGRR